MDWHFEPDPALNFDREFDVIIVGAGAAGCALARGLSMSSLSVLLLDMGGAGHADARVRDGARWKETLRSPIDQALRTTEQRGSTARPRRPRRRRESRDDARRLDGAQRDVLGARQPVGLRMLGGARLRGLVARGHAAGASRHRALAARRRRRRRRERARRGASGPVGVARDLCRGDAAYAALLDVAVRECGFRATEDYNGADGRGDERGADERGADDRIGYMQFNVDAATGERHDAYPRSCAPCSTGRTSPPRRARAPASPLPPAPAGDEAGGAAAPPRACVGVEVEWAAAKSDADAAPPAAADGAPPPPPPPAPGAVAAARARRGRSARARCARRSC